MKLDPKKIKAIGKIASCKEEIKHVRHVLENASFWYPATALREECEEVLRVINNLEEQFDRKLVTAIIGPGGSGKSTLFNALAGRDDISQIGTSRPTTEHIVLLSSDVPERNFFIEHFGTDKIELHEASDMPRLAHMVLIDTPDVDSTRQAHHVRMVQKAIEISDVLLCVFNVENPKTKDHVDFFAPYIHLFHGESLIGILNKCDRIDAQELKEAILPEFKTYIQTAWGRPLQSLLCISARRHLAKPDWDVKAPPKHDFDQFGRLTQLVYQTFGRSGYAIDRRLGNVMTLRDFIVSEVESEVAKDREFLTEAGVRMKNAETSALSRAFSEMRREGTGQVLGINVLLYQKIAQRWMGPVGWMIAIWARILIFGTGVMAIFRFGNPIRQLLGIFSSLRHFKDTKAAISETKDGEQVGSAFRVYRMEILKRWPEISELLIRGRFEKDIRNPKKFIFETKELNALSAMWQETLDTTIDGTAKTFSHLILQILLNLPTVGLLAHAAWLTARHYFSADYLSSDFFMHAFLTIAIVLMLSFFLFQGILRVGAGSDRLMEKAFNRVKMQIDPFQQILLNPAFEQIDALLGFKSSRKGAHSSAVARE